MSAQALRFPSLADYSRWPYWIPAICGIGIGVGIRFGSPSVVALGLVPLALWLVVHAPEGLLVALAAQGTLKAIVPFTAIPIDLLFVLMGLVSVACLLRIRRNGFPALTRSSALMVVLAVLLLVAAARTTIPGGVYKAVYFEAVCGTLFFAPMVLIRDAAGFARLAAGLVIVGLVVADAATPGSIPGQPYTLPGGNEITAAYFPAIGALAALSCLAMRAVGLRRVLLLVVAAVLTAAAVRAGSRGVLIAVLVATLLALVLLVIHARRPVVALTLAVIALGFGLVAAREVVGTSALARYSGLTDDARRAYLRTRALDQALDRPAGLGIGGYGLNLPVLNPRPAVPYPHNIVLEVANESGIVALNALLALLGVGFVMALRLARRRGFALCAAGITFAFIEALASGSVNDHGVLWLMLGLTFAATKMMPAVDGAGRT